MSTPSPYDHLRPADADSDYCDGVYRVVGTDDETVTLLRVTDADGRRAHTGSVVALDRARLDAFVSASNPDGRRSLAAVGASVPEQVYWSARAFAHQLARHPLPSAVALSLVLAGTFGEGAVPLPDVVLGLSTLIGCLGLASIGSGRLSDVTS